MAPRKNTPTMNKQIIEYFQARNKSDASGWPVLLVLPLLIILVPFGFLAAAVMWLYDAIRGLIKKDATISNEEVPYIVCISRALSSLLATKVVATRLQESHGKSRKNMAKRPGCTTGQVQKVLTFPL